MDGSDLRARFAAVAGGLRAAGPMTPEDLTAARLLLARTLAQGVEVERASAAGFHESPVELDPVDLDPQVRADLDTALDAALAHDGEPDAALSVFGLEGRLRAFRRTDPHSTFESLPPSAAGQRIEKTLGPFTDRDGRPVWIDVIRIIRQVSLVSGPGTAPLVTLPLSGLRLEPATTYQIPAGSVWVAARTLSADAPSGYCGVRVTGGTLSLSAVPTVTSRTLTVPAGTQVKLTMSLETAEGTVPGSPVSAVMTPLKITLALGPGGAALTSDDISATVYGSTHTAQRSPEPAYHAGNVGRVVFPYAVEQDRFVAGTASGELVLPRGEAPVARVGWALPVAVTPADQLGEAAGTGGVAITVGTGLAARWTGLAGGSGRGIALGAAVLLAEPGQLIMHADAAAGSGVRHRLTLWQQTVDSGPSELQLGFDQAGFFSYTSVAGGSQSLAVRCTVDAAADRPRQATGARFPLLMEGLARIWQDAAGQHLSVVAAPPRTRAQQGPASGSMAVALTNALLTVAPPLVLAASGDLGADAEILTSGRLSVWMRIVQAVLTLPDPYVTNQPSYSNRFSGPAVSSSSTLLLSTVTWDTPGSAELAFELITDAATGSIGVKNLLTGAVEPVRAQPTAGGPNPEAAFPTPAPGAGTPTFQPVANPFAAFAATDAGAAGRERPNPDRAAAEDAEADRGLRAVFEEVAGAGSPSIVLLDVSSNVDQLGVGFGLRQRGGADSLKIENLHLVTPLGNVRLVLLPQFQWEPVTNQPNPNVGPFPDRLVSGDDGTPTVLGSRSVHLIPVRPDRVSENLVKEFAEAGTPVGAMFTLPFGIRASSMLMPETSGADRWAQISEVRPNSPDGYLQGGRQYAVTAQKGTGDPLAESPTLPGAAWQTRNAVNPSTLAPTGFSVLRADVFNAGVEKYFNDEMGPFGTRPRVPVTRLDLSGYGASLFSRWANPDAVAAVGQVRFNAVAGRTAYEVVQVVSILYPWGVRVVRTITLERAKEGTVLRADSGWVASGPGVYRYPPADLNAPPPPGTGAPLETHPGVVRGVHDVRRIRETGRVVTFTADGEQVELLEVRFDADADIENVVRGHNPATGRVPGLNHTGFVQRRPQGYPLSAWQLAAFLEQEGPVGGPAPCVVDVGGSGQQMTLVRVEVDRCVAQPPGVPEFAAAARGGLHLPSDGEWTVTRRRSDASVPEPVDRITGVPLVRAGRASAPSTTSAYYRFAEASDLLRESSPRTEFSLVQSSDGHQTQFPRPRLAAGSSTLDSTEPPRLADLTVRSSAAGHFAAPEKCFRGPGAWDLSLGPDGRYTFAGGTPTEFQNTSGDRAIVDSAGFAIRTVYAGPIRYFLNAAATPSWALRIEDVITSMDLGPFEDLMGVRHLYRVEQGLPARMEKPEQLYAPFLSPVVSILRFLSELLGADDMFGVIPVPGSFKFQAKLSLAVPPWEGKDHYFDLGGMKIKGKMVCAFGWSEKDKWYGEVGMDFGLQVPALPPIWANGKASVAVKGSEVTQQTVTIRVLWGAALTASLGPFGVSAEFNFGIQVIVTTGGGAWQIGLLIEIVGKANLSIVVIAVRLELLAAIGRVAAPGTGVEFLGRAKFAAEVTVCWFLTISVEYTIEYRDQLAI